MSRILISGFYGFGNLGDEAILETMVRRFRRMDPTVRLTVLSNDPLKTSNEHDVECVNRKSLGGVLKAIRDCDILVSGGGSLLQDVTSGKSIYYYFFIILAGILFKRRVMIYSHGIGPINTPFNRRITGWLLNRVQAISVREANSKEDLIRMGVDPSLIKVTADPVIDLSGADMKCGKRLLEALISSEQDGMDLKPIVGLSLRTKDFRDPEKKDDLIGSLKSLSEECHLVILPFYYHEDIGISKEIKESLPQVHLVDRVLSTQETLDMMSAMDLFVGTRLHSLIIGAVAEIAVIGISYDPKIDYFLETIGLKALLTIDAFDGRIILHGIEEALMNQGEIVGRIRSGIEKQRLLLNQNDMLLQMLMKRGR